MSEVLQHMIEVLEAEDDDAVIDDLITEADPDDFAFEDEDDAW